MESVSLDRVTRFKVNLPDEKSKIEVTKKIILEFGKMDKQVVIFVPTIELAKMLYYSINTEFDSIFSKYDYLQVSLIHGDFTKQEREVIQHDSVQILITTDINYLREGIIPSKASLVINFDLPVKSGSLEESDIEVYLRRFPSKGAVFYLLSGVREYMAMKKIERHLDPKITKVPSWKSLDDFRCCFC